MNCPICEGFTTVFDSRPEVDSVKRRRKCLSCDYRFNTIEVETDMLEAFKKPAKTTIDVEGVKNAVQLLNRFLEGVKKHDQA